jgi:phage recombination protein Bet
MTALTTYSQVLLTDHVKRSFEENYLKMLFEKHKELPKGDIIEFIHKAQQTGANPSLNQIFLIERNTKVGYEWKKVGTVVFSYNFIQAIANQTGEYEGYTIRTELQDKFDVTDFTAKKMLCSICVVKRRGKEFPYTAWWDEYVQTRKDDKTGNQVPSGTWAAKPYMMIEKCALSGALRRAFPEALSGMYCEEEMEAANGEMEKIAQTSVIEAKATSVVEKREEIVERVKTENYEEKESILSVITLALGEASAGMTIAEKSKLLFDMCGVRQFGDLKNKTTDELKFLTEKIQSTTKELKDREIHKEKQRVREKNKVNTFILE